MLPAGGDAIHTTNKKAGLYWVHDAPLLRYLGVEPAQARFEPIFYLKPLLDKGFAGWLYRVAPGPWQVIIHQQADGEEGTVVCTCDERPSYNEAVAMMKKAGYERGY